MNVVSKTYVVSKTQQASKHQAEQAEQARRWPLPDLIKRELTGPTWAQGQVGLRSGLERP